MGIRMQIMWSSSTYFNTTFLIALPERISYKLKDSLTDPLDQKYTKETKPPTLENHQ